MNEKNEREGKKPFNLMVQGDDIIPFQPYIKPYIPYLTKP